MQREYTAINKRVGRSSFFHKNLQDIQKEDDQIQFQKLISLRQQNHGLRKRCIQQLEQIFALLQQKQAKTQMYSSDQQEQALQVLNPQLIQKLTYMLKHNVTQMMQRKQQREQRVGLMKIDKQTKSLRNPAQQKSDLERTQNKISQLQKTLQQLDQQLTLYGENDLSSIRQKEAQLMKQFCELQQANQALKREASRYQELDQFLENVKNVQNNHQNTQRQKQKQNQTAIFIESIVKNRNKELQKLNFMKRCLDKLNKKFDQTSGLYFEHQKQNQEAKQLEEEINRLEEQASYLESTLMNLEASKFQKFHQRQVKLAEQVHEKWYERKKQSEQLLTQIVAMISKKAPEFGLIDVKKLLEQAERGSGSGSGSGSESLPFNKESKNYTQRHLNNQKDNQQKNDKRDNNNDDDHNNDDDDNNMQQDHDYIAKHTRSKQDFTQNKIRLSEQLHNNNKKE